MSTTDRLELALDLAKPSDWGRFEQLCSAFLAVEFGLLRTTASPAGDGGRDSELFSTEGEPSVVMQYSVAKDWESKIRRTVARLSETLPDAQHLIYMSSKEIGASADALKRELRKERGLTLDPRDRNWFVERVEGSRPREHAAERFAGPIVDPYLSKRGVTNYVPEALTSPELIAAMTYLGLHWRDAQRDKGLTKVAFEAITRSVLAGSNPEHRLARSVVQRRVLALLPEHPHERLQALVNAALKRLTKTAVRHWQKDDEFCLSDAESRKAEEYKLEATLADRKLAKAIRRVCASVLSSGPRQRESLDQFTDSVRRTTDALIFEQSQSFALAIHNDNAESLFDQGFNHVLLSELARHKFPKIRAFDWHAALDTAVREIVASEEPAIQQYMRTVADAYTLLVFLRQTPDIQGALNKMFSSGQIWLDATVTLPLFAETLSEDATGRFTRMLAAAHDAGLKLLITEGMIEEVERHMNRSLTCAEMDSGKWEGTIPYLFDRFLRSGRPRADFGTWLYDFRGHQRPQEDVGEFLAEKFNIETRNLENESDAASEELRNALQFLWFKAHENRRRGVHGVIDNATITRLVKHDVECYCGVVQLRRNERGSAFGYNTWWLTMDKSAFNLGSKLGDSMTTRPPDSPVMSADFLVNYLAFGPARRRVGKETEAILPLMMEIGTVRNLTPELLEEAEKLRSKLLDLPERVVRREVRDYLDKARRRLGPIARAGLRELDDSDLA